ncbi:MAG: class I SAM-dependent methyltransferase [Deltaproteobacteria bacterium]|nr:MAG: class I SAM-dependent methyltransferase [Deltaproteobacteria bacterium]
MTAWHEDDALWMALEPVLFGRQRLARAPDEVDRIVALLDLPHGARVLDLACGPGRHACELARRGYRVTAVDRTRAYLDRARARARQWQVDVEFVEADMRAFRREGAFDAVLNLFTSFGYFEDDADNRRVLDHARASLTRGGRLLIDLRGKELIARDWKERWWVDLDDGAILCEERRVGDGWDRLESRWIHIAPDGRRREVRGVQRIYSAAELTAMVRAAGFVNARSFGSLAGGPYDARAERLVIVADA